MKRRINLGCALMHRPRLLLLHEPTGGIDPQARQNIPEFIKGLCAAGTGLLYPKNGSERFEIHPSSCLASADASMGPHPMSSSRSDGSSLPLSELRLLGNSHSRFSVYTTHYLQEAETMCDRIGVINQGKLLAEETRNELQTGLGGIKLFIIEGRLDGAKPAEWPQFQTQFKVIQQTSRQIIAASTTNRHPSDCLKDLLALNRDIENVTLKRPSLNDVFLQFTGRELRG